MHSLMAQQNLKEIIRVKVKKMIRIKPVLVLGTAITLYLTYLSLFGELGVDGGAYLTVSQGILRGQLPYVDFIDHKPPGIYYIFALFLWVWNSVWMIKISLILINLSTAFILYLIATKLWNGYTGVIAGLFYLTGLIIYNGYMVLIEPYMSFFISLSFFGYVLFYQSKEPKYLFLSGLMVGIATILKQPALFLFFGLLLCINLINQTRNLKNNTYLVSGFSIPILITTIYFYINGALEDLIFNVFTLNAGFYKFSGVAEFLYYNILANFNMFPLLWLLTISGVAITARHWRQINHPSIISILLLFSFAPVMTGHGASYYIGILPFASLLAAHVSGCSLTAIGKNQKTFAIVLILFLSLPVLAQIGTQVIYFKSHNLNDEIQIANYIKANTDKEEKIFVMPADAEYYFLSDREPMGKNYWILPISQNKTWSQESIIHQIKEQKINYILIRHRVEIDEKIPEIYNYINRSYQIEKEFINKNIITGEVLPVSWVLVYKRRS